jgi:hypothetical protein
MSPSSSGPKNNPTKKTPEAGSKKSSSIMKMEVTRSSETSVEFQRTTRRYTPEARTLHEVVSKREHFLRRAVMKMAAIQLN